MLGGDSTGVDVPVTAPGQWRRNRIWLRARSEHAIIRARPKSAFRLNRTDARNLRLVRGEKKEPTETREDRDTCMQTPFAVRGEAIDFGSERQDNLPQAEVTKTIAGDKHLACRRQKRYFVG